MKNKEEPSIDSTRGNPSRQPAGKFPGSPRVKTTGSTVRPDDAASASIEKPALSLFPEPKLEPGVDHSKIAPCLFHSRPVDRPNLLCRTA